jgi:hypothetical protein
VVLFLGLAVEILNAASQSFSVWNYPGGYGVGAKRETAGLESNRNEVIGRIEEGCGVATTAASAAVMAGSKSVVRAREDGTTARYDGNARALRSFLQEHFAATRARWR